MQCSYVKDSFLSSGSELNMEMTCKNSAHQEAHKTAGTSNTSKLVKLNSQMGNCSSSMCCICFKSGIYYEGKQHA